MRAPLDRLNSGEWRDADFYCPARRDLDEVRE